MKNIKLDDYLDDMVIDPRMRRTLLNLLDMDDDDFVCLLEMRKREKGKRRVMM